MVYHTVLYVMAHFIKNARLRLSEAETQLSAMQFFCLFAAKVLLLFTAEVSSAQMPV
jgi:hypothetical protein